jgi:hypothetical protein
VINAMPDSRLRDAVAVMESVFMEPSIR